MNPKKDLYIFSGIAVAFGVLVSYLCNTYYYIDPVRYLWLACIFWVFAALFPSICLGLVFKTYRQVHLAPLVVLIAISVSYFGNGQRFSIFSVGIGITLSIALLIPHIWGALTVWRRK